MHYNFDKFEREAGRINSRGSAYDYKSVMHYSSNAFSVNGSPTMVDKSGNIIETQVRIKYYLISRNSFIFLSKLSSVFIRRNTRKNLE